MGFKSPTQVLNGGWFEYKSGNIDEYAETWVWAVGHTKRETNTAGNFTTLRGNVVEAEEGYELHFLEQTTKA